jgi:hypothetical protein
MLLLLRLSKVVNIKVPRSATLKSFPECIELLKKLHVWQITPKSVKIGQKGQSLICFATNGTLLIFWELGMLQNKVFCFLFFVPFGGGGGGGG